MENKCFKLILSFIGDKSTSIFKGYKISNEIYNFEKNVINIPFNSSDAFEEKKIIDFQLLFKKNINKQSQCYRIPLYIGINKAYCFIDQQWWSTYDICCLDKRVRIIYDKMELNELNYLENDTRTRIILINASPFVQINGTIYLYSYIPFNEKMQNENSFQLAFFDDTYDSFSIKAISKEENSEEFSIINVLKKEKDSINSFHDQLKELIDKKLYDSELYKNLLGEIELTRVKNNFSRRKDILKEAFNENEKELYELFYKYILWFICDIKYFPEKDDKDINIPVDVLYKNIKYFYEKYRDIEDLLNYQKILLFYSHTLFFVQLNDEEKYKKSKLEYINAKNVDNNSVFGRSFKFLKDFVKNLNSKSEVFYPLLLLDSGLYYNKDRSSYGFDFKNCDIVKKHLEDLIPDVFFVYDNTDLLDDEKGFNFKGMKIIFLNRLNVLKNFVGNPSIEDKTAKNTEHYAMRVSKFFMHESFGHNKFIYQNEIGIDSPRHFFNKSKSFITMFPKPLKNTNIDYSNDLNFFVEQDKYEGESGNFFEYFFGFYEDELILDLIYKIDNVGKLINNVIYFTSEKLDVLQKYIINKYILQKNKIEYFEKESTTLEQDIGEMDALIKEKNINLSENISQKKEMINSDIKKKDSNEKNLFIDVDEKEIKNYSYYLKKMMETKNNDESRKYARELIFHHLKKK